MILVGQMLDPEICFTIYDTVTILISGTLVAPAMSMTVRCKVSLSKLNPE